ncbi:hypothetical protein BXZ70DRAFT_577166 [Cristinia sonorae]|uniref:Uncharacterized protein n=1 Tax=Cristinia sonorae TaxID=1940300 RepID=A0A8K0XKS5_9AGAR|nr:hypothetical protein BXZ70DRAFT_577166 [Cristinia sonorae]
MSYYQSLHPPMLSLDISRSPLLSGALPKDICDFSFGGPSSPRPTGLPLLPNSPKLAPSLQTRLKQLAKHQQQCIGIRPSPPCNKPLPSLPPSVIPPRQIISVLELLERMDNDVVKEVQRVKEGIAEACVMVREYVQADQARVAEWRKKRERMRKETKGLDDDFWLNA